MRKLAAIAILGSAVAPPSASAAWPWMSSISRRVLSAVESIFGSTVDVA
jgi:hypothetical protein